MTKHKNDDLISEILNDPERVRRIIQSGINKALLRHKQAGNPVCGGKDGKVYWVDPKDIHIEKDNS